MNTCFAEALEYPSDTVIRLVTASESFGDIPNSSLCLTSAAKTLLTMVWMSSSVVIFSVKAIVTSKCIVLMTVNIGKRFRIKKSHIIFGGSRFIPIFVVLVRERNGLGIKTLIGLVLRERALYFFKGVNKVRGEPPLKVHPDTFTWTKSYNHVSNCDFNSFWVGVFQFRIWPVSMSISNST